MTTIKLALCAAILTAALAAPAAAGYRAKPHRPHQVVWVPLFLGVGY